MISYILLTMIVTTLYLVHCPNTGDGFDEFTVIAHFTDIETLYMRMKNEGVTQPNENHDAEHMTEDSVIETRKRVCSSITKSEYFNILGRDPVDVEKDYPDLASKYPSIVEHLYDKATSFSSQTSFNNRMKFVRVAVPQPGGPVVDQAFVCLARNRRTHQIEEYYVSQSYNVSESTANFVGGHFIFRHMEAENVWNIHSFAERMGTVTASTKDAEDIYRKIREKPKPNLCDLDEFGKLRLCATVLATSLFNKQLQNFIPNVDHVSSTCEEREVRLNTSENADSEVVLKEWMVRCGADNLKPAFYIFGGYTPNSAFVLTESVDTGTLSMATYNTGVGVVAGL